MPTLREIALELAGQAAEHTDRRLPAGLYTALSVSTARTRARLRHLGRPFVDPGASSPPPAAGDLALTADWLITRSAAEQAALGGATAIAGAVTMPAEALGAAVAAVRLAQRLAIVYGFDPETESGRIATWKALAAGLDIDLPAQGPLQVRLRDIPGALLPAADPRSAGAWLARQVVRRTSGAVLSRALRWVPLAGPIVAVSSARARASGVGERMRDALQRLAEIDSPDASIEDAHELG